MITINKIENNEKNILVNGIVRPACFVADILENGKIRIVSKVKFIQNISYDGIAVSQIIINEQPVFDNANDAAAALNEFIGNFNSGGGTPESTLPNMCVPDSANKETINRISTNGGTWTADRSGFVVCQLYADSITSGTESVQVTVWINNKRIVDDAITDMPRVRFATEPIPVKTGDVVKLQVVSPQTITWDYYTCYFIPPIFVEALAPVIAENFMNYMCVPDYANLDSASKITAIDGTWTVDRVGFVQLHLYAGASATNCYWSINSKSISHLEQLANSPQVNKMIVPVKIGDIIKLNKIAGTTPTQIYCYFIPPLFVAKSAPVEGVSDTRQGYITINNDLTMSLNKPVNITTAFKAAITLVAMTNIANIATVWRYGNQIIVTMAGNGTQTAAINTGNVLFTILENSPFCPFNSGMANITPTGVNGGNCITFQGDGTFLFWGNTLPVGTSIGASISYFCKGE
jgi:hypothetical protein